MAGPGDLGSDVALDGGVLYLPYWLLGYEAMVSLFVDRSDQNAPNQAMVMANSITDAKRKFLQDGDHKEVLANFTVDSPVPFPLKAILERLSFLDRERVEGAKPGTDKAGDFNGKLSRLIARFEAKQLDRRLGFIFQPHAECMTMEWLPKLAHLLTGSRGMQADKNGGIKIIDFSEVPSDILPLMVSLIARLIFNITQWTPVEARHPIALFCDEAHLYIPERAGRDGVDDISVGIFERIAKEGRKYGMGLVVISQRPSEVNRTVLSQCNNVIAMRLTNGDDQSVSSLPLSNRGPGRKRVNVIKPRINPPNVKTSTRKKIISESDEDSMESLMKKLDSDESTVDTQPITSSDNTSRKGRRRHNPEKVLGEKNSRNQNGLSKAKINDILAQYGLNDDYSESGESQESIQSGRDKRASLSKRKAANKESSKMKQKMKNDIFFLQ